MATYAGTSSSLHYDPAIGLQDPALVASILATAVDVTILMTAEGIICDQVLANSDMPRSMFTGWPGKALSETVTVESRAKIEGAAPCPHEHCRERRAKKSLHRRH